MTGQIVRQCCIVMTFPADGSVADLLSGVPPNRVFTARERQEGLRGTSLATWAGRLAAKTAILTVLGAPVPANPLPLSEELPWGDVEILPDSHGLCAPSGTCRWSHRPVATLREPVAALLGIGEGLAVSISHSAVTALALAVRITDTAGCGGQREAVDDAG